MLWTLLAFQPFDAAIPVGPPIPRIGHDPATQWRMSSRAHWRGFQSRWPGRWFARWDTRNGTPRFLGAPGVPLQQVDELVADVARLAGVRPDDLVGPRVGGAGERTILHWDRVWRGAVVQGDRIGVVAIGETIAGVWVQLTPIPVTVMPQTGEVIFVSPDRGVAQPARRVEDGSQVVFLGRQGQELYRYETRRPGTVRFTLEERTVGDALMEVPAQGVRVVDGADETTVTDADGVWSGEEPVGMEFNGPALRVRDEGGLVEVMAPESTPEPWVLAGGVDYPLAAGTVHHHFQVAWDWLEDRWPTHAWLSEKMRAKVRDESTTCNAWYDGTSVTFGREEPGLCTDFGRIADVVYHELGHGMHHRIITTGTFAGDVSEGSADYVSATINGDAVIAPNAIEGGGFIREVATDRSYPEDFWDEVHNDGLIWASFLWNLREDWMSERGEEAGLEAVDGLFLRALEQGPSLLDLYEAVLLADDDDGDLSDGTPNDCELMERLADHGIGPGPIGVVVFDHTPLGHQASDAEGYPVSFQLDEYTPDCGDLDPDSVAIWYTTTDVPTPGVEVPSFFVDTGMPPLDTGLLPPIPSGEDVDLYEAWTRVEPEWVDGEWLGEIPRQPATTKVRYFMEAADSGGTQIIQTHGGSEDGVYQFWIGDQAEIWCDDLESGGDGWSHEPGVPDAVDSGPEWSSQWEFGYPEASIWGPDSPASGDILAGTALGVEYAPNNAQQLSSPAVDIAIPSPMLMLRFQRWLTVEDGIYDQASIWMGDQAIWQNPATLRGMHHVLDSEWSEQEVPLDDWLMPADPVTFVWALQTDPGLQFGGWHIDDVCVVELADLAGHYRVRDLIASSDLPQVELSWTQPWMTPIARTVLVRKEGSPPSGPEDGAVVDEEDAPTPGQVRTVVDTDVDLGVTYYYALYVAGYDPDSWFADLVLGENLVQGAAVDAIVETDTGDTGAGGTVDTGSADSGDSADSGTPDTAPPSTGDSGSGETETGSPQDTATPSGDLGGPSTDSGETGAPVGIPPITTKDGCGCAAGSSSGRFAVWWWCALLCLPAVRRRAVDKLE